MVFQQVTIRKQNQIHTQHEWSIKCKKVYYRALNGIGHYTEIIGHTLADDSKIDTYKPPDPDDEDMHYAEEIIEKYGNDFLHLRDY